MTVNRPKKNIRQRGTHTHGWGAKKKHRGAGSRGGRGKAGSGKRGDANKPKIWKDKKYFGRHWFKRPGLKREVKSINILDIELGFEKFLSMKNITEKEGFFEIDLTKMGYNKLLGKGRKVTRKYNIIVKTASAKAVSKIEKAGGKVALEPKKQEAKQKPETSAQEEKEPAKAESSEPKK
tara:strand:- start:821 stop:1357 length:537 start_codon:yes stop_codon:yes gene_type:complete